MNSRFFLLFLFISTSSTYAEVSIPNLGLPKATEKLFIGVVENRQKQLEKMQHDREQINQEKRETENQLKAVAQEVKEQIEQGTKQIEAEPKNEFFIQKQSLLNELYQTIRDIIRVRERLVVLLDESIHELQDFLKDPDFNVFKKEYRLSERLFYSFDDLQRLYNLILDQEKRMSLLTDQEKHIVAELDNQKRAQIATKDAYKAKSEQIEAGKYIENDAIDSQQRSDLITLEERIFTYKKMLDGLSIREIEYKIEHVSLQLSITKAHLNIYREYLRTIKPAVRITETDIGHAKEELAKVTVHYRVIKEKYQAEVEKLISRQEHLQKELQDVANKYSITVGREIIEWSKESLPTPAAYISFCEVAALQSHIATFQRRQELLEAKIDLEDEKLKEENLKLHVKESYHKKYTSEEEIAVELRRYEVPKVESQAGLSRFKESISLIADNMNVQKKIHDNIHLLRADLEKQRELLFKSHSAEYHRCFDLLRRAEGFVKEQIDILSKLTGVYSGLTSIISNKLRLIGFITNELESRTIWYRPEYAITWNGIKNIVPDIINFLTFIRNYFTHGAVFNTVSRLGDVVKDPIILLVWIIKLLGIAILLIIAYRFLPRIIALLEGFSLHGFARMGSGVLAGIFTYLYTYFFAISLWILILCGLFFQDIVDSYLYILFYLLSIPYLLYLANRFINSMVHYNQTHDYAFVAVDFQRRFWFVLSVLLYSTIVIFFFREAFILAHYYRSELPTILLAVNFIIFQIALILLIDKEQILGFISTKNEFWLWVREQIDRLYYLILLLIITIIIMSNPYVGFGRLVLYLLFGCVYTIALILVLYWLHGLFKQLASRAFFISTDDIARERFSNAKTWFGIIIIVSFLVLCFIGIVVGAKIWGWPITLSKITELFSYPLIGGDTETPITTVTFFKILIFIFIGFLVAYGLNKFVLDRIFNLLLIDPGVQHTISSITQYSVITIAVFLGFQNANLGSLVNYIVGALILGLGWVLKEPISDFVAYFIILVQRPIKIGDFIKIDHEITGVVRRITARSVILRRKNSTTLVVPNAYLLNRTIVNWNYTRNFIAFDDIIVIVDYDEDPEEVRHVLYEIVENHPNILKNPKPWIRLDNFGEYGYEFMVRGFISSVYTLEKWEIASNIRITIAKVFKEQDISLALPTQVLLTKRNMPLFDTHKMRD